MTVDLQTPDPSPAKLNRPADMTQEGTPSAPETIHESNVDMTVDLQTPDPSPPKWDQPADITQEGNPSAHETIHESNMDVLSREEKQRAIRDFYMQRQEECYELCTRRGCNRCNLSIPTDYHFCVMSPTSDAWRFLGQMPEEIRQDSVLRDCFGAHLKVLTKEVLNELACWPSECVETCVALLSHAYHCPRVQCYFVTDVLSYEPGETVFPLKSEVDTILALTYKKKHYAVVELNLETREVMVWDAARKRSYKVVQYWKQHIDSIIRKHRPKELQTNGYNVVFESKSVKKEIGLIEEGMPMWKCKGFQGGYYQNDDYSCGPIAINRFAENLKRLSGDKVLGNGIDGLVKSVEKLGKENYSHGKRLFKCVLEEMDDFWKKERVEKREAKMQENDEVHTNNEMAGGNKQSDTQPAMGTPKHDRDNSTEELVDTPEDTQPKNTKTLGKHRNIAKEDTPEDTQQKITKTLGKPRNRAKEEQQRIVVGPDDGGGDTWTKVELLEIEYGYQRFLYKNSGLQKKDFTNVNVVQTKYPGLKDVMRYLNPANGPKRRQQVQSRDDVADAICSVPLWGDGELLEKIKNHHWLCEEVFCPPEEIPSECQYTYVEEEGARLNEPMRKRSRRLYEARKREEVKPVELLRCPIHQEKCKTVLKMSK
jgi:hypothetical protein